MRAYILTKTEREILEAYMKKGVKLQDFRVLMFRIKTGIDYLKGDLDLMQKALEKSRKPK